MTEWGKKFETDFKNSFKEGEAFVYRIKTRHTQYKGDSEIADFLVYRFPNLLILELKSTKEKRLPFDMIRANQILGLSEAANEDGVVCGILVQFREPYSHWFIPIDVITDYIQNGAKSIPVGDLPKISTVIEIPFTKKRVTVVLDTQTLLNKLVKEV